MRTSTTFSAGIAVLSALTGVSASISPRGISSRQNNDPQTSLTLDPKVIASGFANDGQDVPAAGQVASLTSTNNFINFCLTVANLPITNGKQITTGSCNPAPIGVIPSVDNMPSSKFSNPKNGDTIAANTAFTISMSIARMETGNFVNAQENYFAAPQQLNKQGQIVGHSHVVVELLDSITQTTPTNPKQFAFFKGLNAAAVNGALTADVTDGLPAGAYRLCSINSSANHQPAIVPIAQHGSLDDCIYFTAGGNGAAAAPAASSAAAAATAAAAGTKGGAAAGTTDAAATASTTAAAATAVTDTDSAAASTTDAVVSTAAGRGKGRKTSQGAATNAAASAASAVTSVAATSAAAATTAAGTKGGVTSAATTSKAAVTSAAGTKGNSKGGSKGAVTSAAATEAAVTSAAAATKAGGAQATSAAAAAITSPAADQGRGRGRSQSSSNRGGAQARRSRLSSARR